MDCGSLGESLAEAALRDSDPPEISAHLAACAACRAERDAYRQTLAMLGSTPAVRSSDDAWDRIQGALDRPRTAAWSWKKKAASMAASFIIGAIAFFWIVSSFGARSAVALVLEASPGSPLTAGALIDTIDTRHYALLSLPSVGRLHVRPGTRAGVIDARTVRLHEGELYAEVDRGPFAIVTDRGTITVRGTRFGVSTDTARTFVYTVEGEVALDESTPLKAGASTIVRTGEPAAAGPAPEDALAWLSPFARPQPAIAASRAGRQLVVTLTNPGAVPVLLKEIRDWSQYLTLEVAPHNGTPFTADLSGSAAPGALAYRRLDGRIQLTPDRPMTINIDLHGLLEPGTYRLRPTFTAARQEDGETWSGMISPSKPLLWTVDD